MTATTTRISGADELPAPTPTIPTQPSPPTITDQVTTMDDLSDAIAAVAALEAGIARSRANRAAEDAIWATTPDDDHVTDGEAIGSWLGMRQVPWTTMTAAERAGHRTAVLTVRTGADLGGVLFFVDYAYQAVAS